MASTYRILRRFSRIETSPSSLEIRLSSLEMKLNNSRISLQRQLLMH
nr:MAG TPA: hypothetical protein [Caudoviricetes sp.]